MNPGPEVHPGVLLTLACGGRATFLNTVVGVIIVPAAFGFLHLLGLVLLWMGCQPDHLAVVALASFLGLAAPHTGLIAAVLAPSWQLFSRLGATAPRAPQAGWRTGQALIEGGLSGFIAGRLFRVVYPGPAIGQFVEDPWMGRSMAPVSVIALAGALASAGCCWWLQRRQPR